MLKIKNFKTKYFYILLVLLFAVVCSYWIFKSRAATADNIGVEAESMTITTGSKIVSDLSASGSQAVTLADPVRQRFPGDPNPKLTGKIYWGSSRTNNGDPYSRQEQYAGKSLSIRRTFQASWANRSGAVTIAKENVKKDRLSFISLKVGPTTWKDFVASATPGSQTEQEIDDILRKLDAVGGPVWLAVQHEPENDSEEQPIGRTPADWRNLQILFRQRLNAIGAKNIAFMPAPMACTWPGGACDRRNEEDWFVPNIWNAYFLDYYKHKNVPGDGLAWKNFRDWVKAKGLPYGVAEWANWDEKDPAKLGPEMRAFWEQGFEQPQQDMLAYSYFDSTVNDSFVMSEPELAVFRDILKNDPRVQRLSTLGGSAQKTVNVKAAGTYKLWARVKGRSATDYAIISVDGAANTFIGGIGLSTTGWTWVDYKDANTASKTQYSLAGGSHNISITSPNSGYGLDKVILVSDGCVPTGDGSKCYVSGGGGTVGDTVLPNVSITAPVANGSVQGSTTVRATATDNVAVMKVEFLVDDVLKKTAAAAPYEWSWDTTASNNGQHKITVKAYDAANNKREISINVTVSNATASTSDLNSDTKVNIQDLSILISKWGSNTQPADINKDGKVNIQDLSILISKWTG